MALVLVADDDEAFADTVKTFLQTRGHQGAPVRDGAASGQGRGGVPGTPKKRKPLPGTAWMQAATAGGSFLRKL